MRNCLIAFVLMAIQVAGQTPLDEIAAAERAFAQRSIDENVRAAFLANFDDQTIAFVRGEPVPGRKGWEERQADNGYLFWWPVWADVASSGDFGFTTGPAVWGGERTDPKPSGGMYYASVWKKNGDGVWKVVADLGSAVYDPAENKKDFGSPKTTLKASKKSLDTGAEKIALFELDKTYISGLNQSQVSFDAKFLSPEARIHRPGRKPAVTPADVKVLEEKSKFTFEQTGGDIASSADMAVTWGRVKAQVVRDGKESTVPACYMRVWKKEGGQWKVILDVIG